MPSLVAEIGDAIESHLVLIGLLKKDGPDEHQQKLIEEKRKQYEANTEKKEAPKAVTTTTTTTEAKGESDFPPSASLCNKCQTKAVIMMDGCMTCLNCGDSKCG